ncbi:hypothetical protein LPB90_06245 [Chryseobacterium sp. LC2016-29]|uniref:hypothetical protein n=1 Tax=Chryseobacterium sp. LC2016-29 TaxID=2897331 RepID=UPI001E48349E|nr:hypothetical protein [Chryseobacterium sp. LC2016-29]MCD0478049.1 hypothetical protein [Chryseobacterium sp. LC2016-29]
MKNFILIGLLLITFLIPVNAKAGQVCGSVGIAVVSVNWCIGWGAKTCKGKNTTWTDEGLTFCAWSPGLVINGGSGVEKLEELFFEDISYGKDKNGFLVIKSLRIKTNIKDKATKLKYERELNSKEGIKKLTDDMNAKLKSNKVYASGSKVEKNEVKQR